MPDPFKAYDIRGVYPDQLDEDLAFRIGIAAAQVLKLSGERFTVGRDMRVSGPKLKEAFIGLDWSKLVCTWLTSACSRPLQLPGPCTSSALLAVLRSRPATTHRNTVGLSYCTRLQASRCWCGHGRHRINRA